MFMVSGAPASGPRRDVPVRAVSLHLIAPLQPEAAHALPPALPPDRAQGQRGAVHRRRGGRGRAGVRRRQLAVSRSVPGPGRPLIQSHAHQRGASGRCSDAALPAGQRATGQQQQLTGSAQDQRQSTGSGLGHAGRLALQPRHQHQDGHGSPHEALR